MEPFVPPKHKYAGVKLTFKGFFHEAVPESRTETWRSRNLVLQYHLEDNTLEVLEPEVRPALRRTAAPAAPAAAGRIALIAVAASLYCTALHHRLLYH